MVHKTKIKVYGYHLDLYKHVNNARYLEFLESARWEIKEKYFEYEHLEAQHLGIVIANINISYRKPAGLGDELEIQSFVSKIGKKSVILHQDIINAGRAQLIADADVTFVIMDFKEQKPISIEGEWRTLLETLQSK